MSDIVKEANEYESHTYLHCGTKLRLVFKNSEQLFIKHTCEYTMSTIIDFFIID